MKNLRDTIFENLDNALENGQFEEGGELLGKSKYEIAIDMIANNESIPPRVRIKEVEEHIAAWFISRADKLEGER